jgi:hypothetical protein
MVDMCVLLVWNIDEGKCMCYLITCMQIWIFESLNSFFVSTPHKFEIFLNLFLVYSSLIVNSICYIFFIHFYLFHLFFPIISILSNFVGMFILSITSQLSNLSILFITSQLLWVCESWILLCIGFFVCLCECVVWILLLSMSMVYCVQKLFLKKHFTKLRVDSTTTFNKKLSIEMIIGWLNLWSIN